MERIFNREQQAVIQASGGYHLVLAPPGCGKTAVLAERIVWAREHGVEFAQMACLTFTNRASRGMRERIYDRMGQMAGPSSSQDGTAPSAIGSDLDALFVGNVHRFCSRFLFEQNVVPEQTAVIDTDTSISILAEYLGEDEVNVLSENRNRQRYSQIINLQHLMYQCREHYPAALMVHRDAMSPAALRELCVAFELPYSQESTIALYCGAQHYREQQALLSVEAGTLLEQLYAASQYEKYKRQHDLIDFEDLLLLTYDVLSAHVAPQRRFAWIQIDEVQDLNPLQLAIIDLFTAPQATVVYLGDPQQAIFSFMGAQTDTLALLRQRACQSARQQGRPDDAHFYNFYHNYRSPEYLLRVFNTYGEHQLGIDPALLPSTQNHTPQQTGDLLLMAADTNADEARLVAQQVQCLYDAHPDETIAVVVAFNADADEVSAALGALPHFKISGIDFFSTAPVRLLLAHLAIVATEHNFIAWSHLFTGLQVYSSNSSSRQFVQALMQHAMTPVDFLDYDRSTYVAEFVQTYEHEDLVVFDTETTGLDVFSDDVVQLAAVKVRHGRVVDELNLFIETSRQLPPMLGDVENPLLAEYAAHEHLPAREALTRFVHFARGCAILGHNATYDYQILQHNMQRYAPELSMPALWPVYWDTLKLARLLRPRLSSYKLRDLLLTLGLQGQNSHLANDDIMATLSLATYCYERGRSIVAGQQAFMNRHQKTIERFRHLYRDLYQHARRRLYDTSEPAPLATELTYAYDYLRDIGRMGVLPKLHYLTRYIEHELITEGSGRSLAGQLAHHMQDLSTMKEADLCGAQSMPERVVVSTVHKAKGLEFDSVFVYDAVDGKYPSVFASTRADAQAASTGASGGSAEEARKFYVALSRARRRLIVSYCRQSISRWGRLYPKQPTPYLASIRQLFQSFC